MPQEEELKQAIALIKAGNKNEAIPILKTILKTDRDNELGWLWLYGCVEKTEDKKYCLKEVLRINPGNEQTKKTLEQLEPNPTPQPTNEEIRMNDKVKLYLQKAKEQELIRRGLYDKKFYDLKEVSEEMKKKLYYSSNQLKYYENIPYDISDEEFYEVMKVLPIKNISKSRMPDIFNVIGGLLFIGGAIGGWGAAQPGFLSVSGFNWQLAWTVWLCAFISGMTFLGFGKIIELLIDINNK